MTWTATYAGANRDSGIWVASIVYSDGAQKVERTYRSATLTDDWLKAQARAEVALLDAAKADAGKVSLSPGQEIDLTPPASTPPDPARLAFNSLLREYEKLLHAVGIGVILPGDQRVTDASSALKSAWKDEYLGSL